MAFRPENLTRLLKVFEQRYGTAADARFIWHFMMLYLTGQYLGEEFADDAMRVMDGLSEQMEAALGKKYEPRIGDFLIDLRDARVEWEQFGRLTMDEIERAAFAECKKVQRQMDKKPKS